MRINLLPVDTITAVIIQGSISAGFLTRDDLAAYENVQRMIANATTITGLFLATLLVSKVLTASTLALTGLALCMIVRSAFASNISEHMKQHKNRFGQQATLQINEREYRTRSESDSEVFLYWFFNHHMGRGEFCSPSECLNKNRPVYVLLEKDNFPRGERGQTEESAAMQKAFSEIELPKDWESVYLGIGDTSILWSLVSDYRKKWRTTADSQLADV